MTDGDETLLNLVAGKTYLATYHFWRTVILFVGRWGSMSILKNAVRRLEWIFHQMSRLI